MDQILPIILNNTYSLTQLKHRLNILKSYFLQTFFGGSKTALNQQDEYFLKSLPPLFFNKFNKNNVYKLFNDLENQIKKLPTLTIYLTFETDDQTLSQIGEFIRETLNPSLMLDVKLDPSLIAGAALSWKGVYRDYSLRAKLEEKKGEILGSFKRFLR
ncbi:F0F1 ATP synthase subunit delta [Candidatus Roizmanbacteria bacterium]|nr:F0F1 ATP synthase subunit delta [Candidatus Roizmanbacteria bacterium]